SFNTSASMNADTFVKDWLIPQARDMRQNHDQLFLAASDGELYGHHMKEREQFLSYLIKHSLENNGFIPTFPALWLRSHPTTEYAEINENTSWSCHHGIKRWQDVCGEAPEAFWKAPLRKFLDQLASALDEQYFKFTAQYISNPWALRNAYSKVLLTPTTPMETMIAQYALKPLDKDKIDAITIMLEAQFDRLRMHSSDAWFFFDFDSIEPLNGLKYAAHAVMLVKSITGLDVSAPLCPVLAQAIDKESGLTGDSAFRRVLAQYKET
ncbi:MAG: DUF3536 domain-containing protein, partial [Anaerolineaceae bacterium]|nr:DUF3536 domain-containing protein [Anaerolineaceae bacterium]